MKRTGFKLKPRKPLMQSRGFKPRTGSVKVCPICNVEFYLKPSYGSRKFCSVTCANKNQETGKNYNCTVCGKEYYKSNGQIKHRGETKYCSQKCKGVAMKKMIRAHGYKPPKKLKPRITTLKRKLWKVFALYIKRRDGYICFTCGVKCEGGNAHAGHFIPKSVGGMALYFHEDNVHCQCARCNIWLSGHQWEYGIRLGPKVKELEALKGQITKVDESWYLEKIAYYTEKITQKL